VLPDSFWAVPRAPILVLMFCVIGPVLGGTEGAESSFHLLRSQTRLGQYRGRQVLFSYFALPDPFRAVPKASVPVFMFCTPKFVFDGTEDVGSRFVTVSRATVPVFMFYAPKLFYGGTEYVGSNFHVLRSRTRFRRYQGHSVLFSCFALPDSFLTVSRASGPFLIFSLLDSFWAVRSASGFVFMFGVPRPVLGGTEGVMSNFDVLCSRTHFRWYRVRRFHFSCFALLDSFSVVSSASVPVFMFCAAGLVFSGTVGVGYCFHVLLS
jgi:hypothetical protein